MLSMSWRCMALVPAWETPLRSVHSYSLRSLTTQVSYQASCTMQVQQVQSPHTDAAQAYHDAYVRLHASGGCGFLSAATPHGRCGSAAGASGCQVSAAAHRTVCRCPRPRHAVCPLAAYARAHHAAPTHGQPPCGGDFSGKPTKGSTFSLSNVPRSFEKDC